MFILGCFFPSLLSCLLFMQTVVKYHRLHFPQKLRELHILEGCKKEPRSTKLQFAWEHDCAVRRAAAATCSFPCHGQHRLTWEKCYIHQLLQGYYQQTKPLIHQKTFALKRIGLQEDSTKVSAVTVHLHLTEAEAIQAGRGCDSDRQPLCPVSAGNQPHFSSSHPCTSRGNPVHQPGPTHTKGHIRFTTALARQEYSLCFKENDKFVRKSPLGSKLSTRQPPVFPGNELC